MFGIFKQSLWVHIEFRFIRSFYLRHTSFVKLFVLFISLFQRCTDISDEKRLYYVSKSGYRPNRMIIKDLSEFKTQFLKNIYYSESSMKIDVYYHIHIITNFQCYFLWSHGICLCGIRVQFIPALATPH